MKIYTYCSKPGCYFDATNALGVQNLAHDGIWKDFSSRILQYSNASCDDSVMFLDADVILNPNITHAHMEKAATKLLSNAEVVLGAELGLYQVPANVNYAQKYNAHVKECPRHLQLLQKAAYCTHRTGPCEYKRRMMFPNTGLVLTRCKYQKQLFDTVLQHYNCKKGDQGPVFETILRLNLIWTLDYCNTIMLNMHQFNTSKMHHFHAPITHFNGLSRNRRKKIIFGQVDGFDNEK
jgi:hypothetical protein